MAYSFTAWAVQHTRSRVQSSPMLVTARNEVGARLYFHRRLWFCSQGWGGVIPACIAGGIPACLAAGLWGWYLSMPCRFPGPHPRGKFGGSGPGPQPRRKLRGIWSKPTAKGEVEGDLVQAHTQGEVEGDLARGVPPPGGASSGEMPALGGCLLQGRCLLGGWSAPGGLWRPPTCDGYCCGRYASYWNTFLCSCVLLYGSRTAWLPCWLWDPGQMLPEVENRGISGPQKWSTSSKFFFKKCYLSLSP